MRIANDENNALNWVSISLGGALDMTHCDFRSDKDRNRGAERRTKITYNFCASCVRRRLRAADASCTS